MKIESVETINLVFEYPPDERFRYGGGVCTHRLPTRIRVHTASGLTGIGSIETRPSLAYLFVRDQLAPL